MKAVVFNLGCKVNYYESNVLKESLRQKGYDVYDELVFADIYVLNTCAVTAEAERKSRQAISRCRAFNPAAKIFVCGCASQNNPENFHKDNVIFVTGSAQKNSILDRLEDTEYSGEVKTLPTVCESSFLPRADRTRAFVKIQDGCDSFCSYCIIPYLRGRSRSRNADEIVSEIERLSATSKEIVLTGINIMSYGADTGTGLTELIRRLKDIDCRIRIGSFYAEGISEELLDALFSLKKFCPHFHLSLQSGDDEVLKAMNRKYTSACYEQKVKLIRSYDPNACVATDVITGFPTERQENHIRSVEFIKRVGFSDIHVFPFSPRMGTKAAKLPSLPSEIVKQRRNELLDLKKSLHKVFLKNNVGIKHEVLIEAKQGDYFVGYSRNYVKIYTDRNGEIINCVPTAQYKDGLKEDIKQ